MSLQMMTMNLLTTLQMRLPIRPLDIMFGLSVQNPWVRILPRLMGRYQCRLMEIA